MMRSVSMRLTVLVVALLSFASLVSPFATTSTTSRNKGRIAHSVLSSSSQQQHRGNLVLSVTEQQQEENDLPKRNALNALPQVAIATTFFILSSVMGLPAAHADEWGVETEAPTLFTGESVMICTKRGPLGACLKTEVRTAENDNDKADKYFRDPSPVVKEKDAQMRASLEAEDSASELIQKLKQQTQDNKERNELLVKQKTAQNDQSASFGPFDRQVVILNQDGRGFTLLNNPQAMRLKEAGFIKDRQFVKQPSQEELDDALEASNGGGMIGGLIKGILGGDGEE